MEEQERDKTGIQKPRKSSYNKVFGYYLEVTNSYKDMVPDDYVRKQTLTNAERYITPRAERAGGYDFGCGGQADGTGIRSVLRACGSSIAAQVRADPDARQRQLPRLDVFASLALVAERNHYVRPKMNEKGVIDIKDGRHPVVEQMIDHDMFIPNDTYLDNQKPIALRLSQARIWLENPPICGRRP